MLQCEFFFGKKQMYNQISYGSAHVLKDGTVFLLLN